MISIAFEDFYGMPLTGFHLGFIAACEAQLEWSVPLSAAPGGASRREGGPFKANPHSRVDKSPPILHKVAGRRERGTSFSPLLFVELCPVPPHTHQIDLLKSLPTVPRM